MKRIILTILIVVLDLGIVSNTGLAAQPTYAENTITEELDGDTYSSDIPLDNDSLFEEYVDTQLQVAPVTKSAKRSKLTGTNLAIYNKLKEDITKVADGESESTIFYVSVEDFNLEKNGWTATDLGVDVIVENGEITQETIDAVFSLVNIDFAAIVKTLLADCPYDLYWYDKVTGSSYTGPGISAENNGEEWIVSISEGLKCSFSVAQGYSSGKYKVDTSNAERVQKAVDKAKSIVEDNKDRTDYDKLLAYRDDICSLVEYDQEAIDDENTPYGDSWQVISVFDEDTDTNVVCEGYSKAFQYLCDLSDFADDIRCISVTGNMSGGTGEGPHMWNIVKMENGNNYLVDMTICDSIIYALKSGLFLAGVDEGSINEYTVNLESEGLPNVNYIYDANTLALFDESDLKMSASSYKIIYDGDYEFENIKYSISNGKAKVVGYIESPVDITFPSEVKGTPVVEIGSLAFAGCQSLKTITLSDSIITIGYGAFTDCDNLESVYCADTASLTLIDKYAFSNCINLSLVQLPPSIRTLEHVSFQFCSSLKSIYLPEGLERIEQEAFGDSGLESLELPASLKLFHEWQTLYSLERIDVREGNNRYESIDGVLYTDVGEVGYALNSGSGTVNVGWNVYYYPWAKKAEEYIVPDRIKLVYPGPFQNNNFKYLKSIKLNDDQDFGNFCGIYPQLIVNDTHKSYNVIDGVVYDKDMKVLIMVPRSLTGDITVPEGVEEIGRGAADCAKKITSVALPETIQKIGDFAFESCESLKTINLPSNVNYIGKSAFMWCYALRDLIIPYGISEIPDSCFYCYGGHRIFIPDSVKTIGKAVFASDKTIYYSGTPQQWKEIEIAEYGNTDIFKYISDNCLIHYNSTCTNGEIDLDYESLGHIWNWDNGEITKTPTCEDAGTIVYTCARCEKTRTENIPPSHVPEKIEAVWPTCTSTGLAEGSKCALCGKILQAQVTLPMNAHMWDEGRVTKEPAVNIPGEMTYTCLVCGTTRTETIAAGAGDDQKEANVSDNPEVPGGQQKPEAKPRVQISEKVSGIILTGISSKIAAGKTVQLTTSILPLNAVNKNLKWSSSNSKVATVTQTGKVTIKKGTGGKSVTITAASTDGSGKSASFKIKVMKGAVKKITVKGAKKTLKVGKTMKLKAVVKVTKGKPVNKKIKWISNNTNFATVNSKGVVKVLKAGKGKKVKITAMATDGTGKKKVVTIIIK